MKNKTRQNVIILTTCGYIGLAIIAIAYLFIFPYSSLAANGVTTEGYYGQAKHYRNGGTGAAVNFQSTGKINADNLEISFALNTTVQSHNQNNHQFISTQLFDISTISTIYLDYEFDWSAGSCEILVPWGGNDSYFNLYFTKTADQSRTIATSSVSRSDTSIAVGAMVRNISGSLCTGTLKVYDIYDEDGVHYLNFEAGGGGETIYVPVNVYATSVECINNASGTDCDFTYGTSSVATSTAYMMTVENSFYLIIIFVIIACMSYWLVRKFT